MTRMTLKEYRVEQAERGVSADDRLQRLTGESETLNTRQWTDAQIRAIPEGLVEYAFQHSLTLQREFLSLSVFMAYRRAYVDGRARIANATQVR